MCNVGMEQSTRWAGHSNKLRKCRQIRTREATKSQVDNREPVPRRAAHDDYQEWMPSDQTSEIPFNDWTCNKIFGSGTYKWSGWTNYVEHKWSPWTIYVVISGPVET